MSNSLLALRMAGCLTEKDSSSSLPTAGPSVSKAKARYSPLIPAEEVIALRSLQLQQNSSNNAALLERSKAYIQLHDYAAAWCDLNAWIQLRNSAGSREHDTSSYISAVFYRGLCSARLSSLEEAMRDFDDVLQMQPTHARALYERAACHIRADNLVAAIADYESALRCDVGVGHSWKPQRATQSAFAASRQQHQRRCVPAPLAFSLMSSPHGSKGSVMAATPEKHFTLHAQSDSPLHYMGEGEPMSDDKALFAAPDSGTDTILPTVSLSELTYPNLHNDSRRRPSVGESDYVADDVLSSVSSNTGSSHCRSITAIMASAVTHQGKPTSCSSAGTAENGASPAQSPSRTPDGGHMIPVDFEREAVSPGSPCRSDGSCDAKVNYFYQRGLYHRRRDELREAIEMYTKALELDPMHFKIIFNRAYCYDRCKKYKEAVVDYQRALRVDPRNPFTYYNLGISYDHMGRYTEAVKAFTDAIERSPNHADFYHNRGFSQRKCGNYAAAIADYAKAITLEPRHFKSLCNRAYCYSKLCHYAEAVDDYTAGLLVDPNSPSAYHNRGMALERLGRLEEAMEDYTRAISCDSSLAISVHARGLVLDQLGCYEDALKDFAVAIQQEPINATWVLNRGNTYRKMGLFTEAVADYTRSIQLSPNTVAAYHSRALAYRKLRRYELAVKDYTRVLEQDPTVLAPRILSSRAYCYARLERFANAIADYTEVLRQQPNNTHAMYNRGLSYEKIFDFQAAVGDFTKAIHLAPNVTSSASAYYSRGTSQLQLQQLSYAKEDLKKALKLDMAGSRLTGDELRAFQSEHPAYKLLMSLSR